MQDPAATLSMGDFVQQVKLNCNISDAKFWGYYSICGLLMRYRDLYRNEHSLDPWDTIDNERVAGWIQQREALWRELEARQLQGLIIEGKAYDPFDVNGLNAVLNRAGLVYGSGYGAFNKPSFFVAELETARDLYDYRVHYAGKELCRDIAAAPAMLQGRCIYVRSEMISQLIWDRFQETRAHPHHAPAEAMFSHYGMAGTDDASSELHAKILLLARDAAEVFVMHEAGEAYEDEYDDDWREILFKGCDKATELFLRGIKDVRADTSSFGSLKTIYETADHARLCILIAFMDGIRREIFPEIRAAFQQLREHDDWSVIEGARVAGYQRAAGLQAEVVRIWKETGDTAALARYLRDEFPRPGQGKSKER